MKRDIVKAVIVLLFFVCYQISGIYSAIRKGLANRAEWNYYRDLVELPLAEATGPDKMIFGYLPGAKALLTPFLMFNEAGLFAYIVFNVLSGLLIILLLYKLIPASNETAVGFKPVYWMLFCGSIPVYLVLQNNQLVLISMLLLLLGFVQMQSDREVGAGVLLAFAALFKTLVVPVFALPLLLGRWKTTLVAGLATILLSFSFATFTDGLDASIQMHTRWIAQVSAQSPERVVSEQVTPISFSNNQSSRAEIVRLVQATGAIVAMYAHFVFYGLVTILLVVLTIDYKGQFRHLTWMKVSAWLAWVAYAAPFGRYYYIIYLLPTFYIAGSGSAFRRGTWQVALWIVVLMSFFPKGHTPVYAIATACGVVLSIAMLAYKRYSDKSLHEMT